MLTSLKMTMILVNNFIFP